jgi:hypothetical protein
MLKENGVFFGVTGTLDHSPRKGRGRHGAPGNVRAPPEQLGLSGASDGATATAADVN